MIIHFTTGAISGRFGNWMTLQERQKFVRGAVWLQGHPRWYARLRKRKEYPIGDRDQENCPMSAREMLRTTLLNLLEEEMGETFAPPQDDVDLREALGLDSVDLVGLVMRIEREFRVRLSSEELATVKQVGDLLDLMESKLVHVGGPPNGPEEAKLDAD
jgi:acyl carrier protein